MIAGGGLATPIVGGAAAWAILRLIALMPKRVRARQIATTAAELVDLSEDVDSECVHVCGTEAVTLVEYGD